MAIKDTNSGGGGCDQKPDWAAVDSGAAAVDGVDVMNVHCDYLPPPASSRNYEMLRWRMRLTCKTRMKLSSVRNNGEIFRSYCRYRCVH